jgi:hypothetical protein
MQNAKSQYLNRRYTNNDGHSGRIVEYVNSKTIYLQFDSGYVGCFQLASLNSGKFKDKMSPSVFGVGFIGDGEYKARIKGKNTKAYSVWASMFTRCYDEKTQIRQPTYKGCTVSKEWHNFQNFAKWFMENYPNDGKQYQLDKDSIIKGNKVYSPVTCCFLSPQQNVETSQAKRYKFISPSGEEVEVYNLRKFCRENSLDRSTMLKVANGKFKQHYGWKSP